jgi:hypothetical protein
MYQKLSMSSSQLHPRTLPARLLAKCLLVFASVFLVATSLASAADPFGATLHNDGTTTFRVWAPFVDDVGVKINGGGVVPLAQEPGHTDPADTTWIGTVPGTKAGDRIDGVVLLRGKGVREHPNYWQVSADVFAVVTRWATTRGLCLLALVHTHVSGGPPLLSWTDRHCGIRIPGVLAIVIRQRR